MLIGTRDEGSGREKGLEGKGNAACAKHPAWLARHSSSNSRVGLGPTLVEGWCRSRTIAGSSAAVVVGGRGRESLFQTVLLSTLYIRRNRTRISRSISSLRINGAKLHSPGSFSGTLNSE